MTEREIIKGLECCYTGHGCKDCPYYCGNEDCPELLIKDALDLINRQNAEIERWKKKANTPFAKVTFDRNKLQEMVDECAKNIEIDINLAKSEAIKEFAKELKNCFAISGDYLDIINIIENLVKEMTEEE